MSGPQKVPGQQGEDSPVSSSGIEEKKKREYKDFGHDEEKPTRKRLSHLSSLFLNSSPDRCQCGHVLGLSQLFVSIDGITHLDVKIELKAEDLYDKEKVDLETIVVEDVFKLLQCDDNGLNTEEAQRRLEIFGPNKLEQEEQNALLQVNSFSSSF